jgi:hypothetical protein
MHSVGGTQYLTFVRPGGTHQPFIVKTGYYILHLSVAIFIPHFGIKWLKARRQNDCPHVYFYLLRRLIQVDGIILAYCLANATLLLFQIETAFVDVRDQGNGLSEIDVDGFVFRDLLIELIRVLDRAVFYTGRTTSAFILQDISGLSDQSDPEVSRLSFYTVNVSIGQDFYVGVPADLDQFGCKYSYGAVVGGKGLVKLGHMAANGRCLVDQVYPETSRGKIQRGLNTADPSTNHHHISILTARETPEHVLNAVLQQ